jgi:alkaline phosphatase D
VVPGVPLPKAAVADAGPDAPWLALGPMIGHTTSTNTRIWAAASRSAQLSVRLSRREDLSDPQTATGPRLEVDAGFMGHVLVGGLEPAQRYYYCLFLDGHPAMARPYPSFVTAPREGESGRVRFAFTSCVGYHGHDAAPGYADMASRTNFDLLLMLGDNHYANTNSPEVQRRYYADQRRQSGWRELAAHTPVYAIWDDHDYGPDNSDGTLEGKAQSLKTFVEHWANPAYGEPGHPGIFSKFTWRDVEFFLLDDRYNRSPNRATNAEQKTMLGDAQRAWLKRELLASTARIKVLVSGGEWQSHGTEDSWTSFKRERDDLYRFLENHNLSGVLLISGDRHYTAAYQVKSKWVEVAAGPIGSSTIQTKNSPEMFFKADVGKYYCVYDLDTRGTHPSVTLEIYRVAHGLVERRALMWDEIIGASRIRPLGATDGNTETVRSGKGR